VSSHTGDGRSAGRRGTAKERLFDAAGRVFAERGYHASSVDEIVQAAGVTKGALYGHFASKQDLFIALLEDRIGGPAVALAGLSETVIPGEGIAEPVGQGLSSLVDEQRDAVLLTFEFWALAVRDPVIRERYNAWLELLTDAVAHAVTARHEATGVPLTMDARDVAAGILALGHGLAMRQLAEPDGAGAMLMTPLLDLLYGGLVRRSQS
jgi:AcrR family transcriptional regulator